MGFRNPNVFHPKAYSGDVGEGGSLPLTYGIEQLTIAHPGHCSTPETHEMCKGIVKKRTRAVTGVLKNTPRSGDLLGESTGLGSSESLQQVDTEQDQQWEKAHGVKSGGNQAQASKSLLPVVTQDAFHSSSKER